MNKDSYIEYLYLQIEQLNQEKQNILQSRDYNAGKALFRYLCLLRHGHFIRLFNSLKLKWTKHKVSKKYDILVTFGDYYNEFKDDNSEESKISTDTNVAAYICEINGYDTVPIPLIKVPKLDYYLITDEPEKYAYCNDYYKIIKISNTILSMGPVLANRYIKFHPSEFLKGYDYAIYLDGNVRPIGNIRSFADKVNPTTGIAMHLHRSRNCIYKEAKACIEFGRGNRDKIIEQCRKYEKEGFPKEYGMNEATIIVSDLHSNRAIELLNSWWKEFKESGSMRDQLAWPYVLWKKGFKISDVGCLGINIYKNYKVEMELHN